MSSNSVTVVIPSLGGAHLSSTIETINDNLLVPKEIIICIPKELVSEVVGIKADNIKVLPTNVKGQVKQRIEGFKESDTNYVIQLDDDILLDKNCIYELVNSMNQMGDKCSISPALLSKKSQLSVHKKKINFFIRIFYWLINGQKGYLPGTVTKAGTCIGIDTDSVEKELIETEWLSGGMIIHCKKNLILENYFPFDGKAYSEDLIHSFLMKKKNINLYVDKKSKCFVNDEAKLVNKTIQEFMTWIKKDYKARKYFVNLSYRSEFFLHIYYIKEIFTYITMKIFKF